MKKFKTTHAVVLVVLITALFSAALVLGVHFKKLNISHENSNANTNRTVREKENQAEKKYVVNSGAATAESKSTCRNGQKVLEIGTQADQPASKNEPDQKTAGLKAPLNETRESTNEPEASNTVTNRSFPDFTDETGNQAKKAIDKAVGYLYSYYSEKNFKGLLDWPAVALYDAGEELSGAKWTEGGNGAEWREKEVEEGIDFDLSRATDYQRTILSVLASGKDPRNFAGKDLVKAVLNSQLPDGKFADTVDQGGGNLVNAHIWGIICLYAEGGKIPNKDSAYKWLVSHQNKDGGFGIAVNSNTSDIDMTGMALAAFGALEKDYKDKYVEKTLKYLSSQQLENGGFQTWGVENPESAAAVVQGLIAVRVDPTSEEWTRKNGSNPVKFILTFQLSDGSFKHTADGEPDLMATCKSLMALADYYNGKSVFKKMREKNQTP